MNRAEYNTELQPNWCDRSIFAMAKMTVSTLLLLIVFLHDAYANSEHILEQGFFMISNMPQRGRKSDALFLYALNTAPIDSVDIEFHKEGLPSDIVQTGQISADSGSFGCYMKVHQPKKMPVVRYGFYTATHSEDALSAYAFVRPRTTQLDTLGTYTATIWPEAAGSTELHEDSATHIGVAWRPGCLKLVWCKGRVRIKNTGPRLELTSTKDEGLYTIRRRRRGNTFVQILVIAASCPPGQFWNSDEAMCKDRVINPTCMNGGVGRNDSDACLCPPLYVGSDCSNLVEPAADKGQFLLVNFTPDSAISCGDIPGGKRTCEGFLFCLGDLYGCSCSPGWYGNNCDRPCQPGRWGLGCKKPCPPNSLCDRFSGDV